MSPNISNLFVQAAIGIIIYTMILMAARRYAEDAGFRGARAAMSLLLWIAVDGILMLTSFFLASSTYKMWLPTEGSVDEISALFRGWFEGSDLEIADLFALGLTLLVFGVAHAFAFAAILVRQSVTSEGEERPSRPVLRGYIAGLFLLGGVLFYLLRNWECPVIAVRIAQMLGSDKFDAQIEDILKINDIWDELISKSWLMTTIVWVWSIAIVFTSWATVKGSIAFENAMTTLAGQNAPEDTTPPEAETGVIADTEAITASGPVVPVEAAQERMTPNQTAEDEAEHAERRATEARARNARHHEMDAIPQPVAVARSAAETNATDTAEAQALLDQNTDLQSENDDLRREITAVRAQGTRSPLNLPNLSPPAFALSNAFATTPAGPDTEANLDEPLTGATSATFSRNGSGDI